jgi:hypothetical protein
MQIMDERVWALTLLTVSHSPPRFKKKKKGPGGKFLIAPWSGLDGMVGYIGWSPEIYTRLATTWTLLFGDFGRVVRI